MTPPLPPLSLCLNRCTICAYVASAISLPSLALAVRDHAKYAHTPQRTQ